MVWQYYHRFIGSSTDEVELPSTVPAHSHGCNGSKIRAWLHLTLMASALISSRTCLVSAEACTENELGICPNEREANEPEKLDTSTESVVEAQTAEVVAPDDKGEDGEDRNMCGLYMAESSIPGAGLGLYTAHSIAAGSKVGSFPDDPRSAAVTDLCFALVEFEELGQETIVSDYWWDSGMMGTEVEGEEVASLCPGFGMVLNGHMLYAGVEIGFPTKDDGGLHRATSPGAGAITHYHDTNGTAKFDIPAGSELFIDYGDTYYNDRMDTFKNAYTIRDKVREIAHQHMEVLDTVTDLARNVLFGIEPLNKFAHLKPQTVAAVKNVVSENSISSPVKSAEWLRKNGMCADNIRAGPSTNTNAGRGAFANRLMLKGDLIAPTPMLLFPQSDLFDSDRTEDEFFEVTYPDGRTGHQLLVNYCFGHRDSSVLMFPYHSHVNLINHNSTVPNAELRWSDSKHTKKRLLETRLEDIPDYGVSGLLLEFIALRDIQPGEEVFINYGREWELAWNDHVAKWEPEEGSESYLSGPIFQQMNLVSAIRTLEEQEEMPYPENIETACFFDFPDDLDERLEEAQYDNTEIMYEWEDKESIWMHYSLHFCDVLERLEVSIADKPLTTDESDRHNGEDLYTVQVFNYPHSTSDDDFPDEDFALIVTGVPRRAIDFVDAIQSSDQHLKNAFRQSIDIPDSIFPEKWKNRPGINEDKL